MALVAGKASERDNRAVRESSKRPGVSPAVSCTYTVLAEKSQRPCNVPCPHSNRLHHNDWYSSCSQT